MRLSFPASMTCSRVAVIVVMPKAVRSLRRWASSAMRADPVCSKSLSYSMATFASGQNKSHR